MGIRLSELAERTGARLEGDGALEIRGPAPLETAGSDEISFLGDPRYAGLLASTAAGAVVIAHGVAVERTDLALLRADDPSALFTAVVAAFAGERARLAPGVHAGATVAPDAAVAEDARIGAGAVVESGARIGARAELWPGAYVGHGASIGADTVLQPGARVLEGVAVGERCLLHAGCVVGSEGFGFDPSPEGWKRIPQVGVVVVEDDVEIGANATVDRARFGATRIGRGSRLDNLVHVAHNVVVGEHCAFAAQAGVAGSTRLGDWVVLGGQAGIGGHVRLASGVRVGGQGGVYGSITEPGDYIDTPARPRREALRRMAAAGKAGELARRVKDLEARLAQLEARGEREIAQHEEER